jgi:hypothetical protein
MSPEHGSDVEVASEDYRNTPTSDGERDIGAIWERLDPDAVMKRFEARGETMSRAEAEQAAERARRIGHLMDDAFEIPGLGYRIGLDPLIGIAPVAGDAVAAAASLYIVFEGFRVGVPLQTLTAMLLFIGLDFLVGSVPVLGPIVDAVLKVNERNATTLESYVESSFAE